MLEMQKMGTKERVAMPQNFITFRNGYLFVYSLMMGECVYFLFFFSPLAPQHSPISPTPADNFQPPLKLPPQSRSW